MAHRAAERTGQRRPVPAPRTALALALTTLLLPAGATLAQPAGDLPKPPPLGAPTPPTARPPAAVPPLARPPAATPPTARPPASVASPASPFALRAEDAARTPPLRPDQPVQVRLTRGQSAFFRVAPEAGPHYAVTTRRLARGTDTVLEGLDAAGQAVLEDDDGGGGLASQLEIGPEDNVATIRAGVLGNEGGTFEVVLTREAAPPPPDFATTPAEAASRPPLAVDQAVRVRLRRGQTAYFALPSDRADLVALTRELRQGTDTELALLDSQGEVLSEDDDGGEGLASLLPLSDQPNAVVLRASTIGGGAGEFTLVLQREAPRAPPNFPTSLEAARARGPLAPGESISLDLGRRQFAYFPLAEGQDITAYTRNLDGNTDTVLALLDADGEVILEDDDGGEGLASRLTTSDAGRPAAFLRAGILGGQPGRFDLVVEAAAPAPAATDAPDNVQAAAGQAPLVLGESVSLRLRAGQSAVFALPNDGRPLVAMTYALGRNTDTVLELLDGNGAVQAENDDSDGLASRVAIPAEGRPAFIRARLLGNSAGSFQLVLVRPAP
ncbi:hypothetical protein [Muricoccus radiodurans]|uniref:hypothetical protein n=1 Tax=Muricoccus radiodurans TaxID=2231721 RepID=UPI003CF2D485